MGSHKWQNKGHCRREPLDGAFHDGCLLSSIGRAHVIVPISGKHAGYIAGIVRNESGVLLGVGGMPDHLHLITKFKPDRSVAEMVRLIKANSSKWVNENHGETGRFAWQADYGAFSGCSSQLGALRAYVTNQRAHHRTRSFQDEYIHVLNKHGIEYDEKHLWG